MSLPEILKLSIPERILLVEAIWDSIANEENSQHQYQLSPEQISFLEEEMKAYSKNPEDGSSWEEIKKRVMRGK